MSRRGICLIWFRGRHISPLMPYREARSVAESSEGPTASKSDRTGRNPGMTRLVRRSSAVVWRYCILLSCSNIPSAHALMFRLSDTYLVERLFFLINISLNILYLVMYLYMPCILAVNVMPGSKSHNGSCWKILALVIPS